MANGPLMYRDYMRTLSQRFEANISYIQYIYNFDSGDEFEVAICKMLRPALPQQFGICRGHGVGRGGQQEGDDIIIYDRIVFPTLRLLPEEDYSRKEWIPIESVYAYIEAKQSLDLRKKEPDKAQRGTFTYAMSQVSRVKELCLSRPEVRIEPAATTISNRLFTIILCRIARDGEKEISEPTQIRALLTEHGIAVTHPPDQIMIGAANLLVPAIQTSPTAARQQRLFFEPGCGYTAAVIPGNLGWGYMFCSLLAALDTIHLGSMPWLEILNEVVQRGNRQQVNPST